MGKERVILHCDLNNFYASVECRYDPRLREVPMAVGGSEENRHGIVLAKNELAKQFGIKTAETLWQARQKCPELVVVPPHYERYYEVSRAARAIYARYTDRIEPFGIDECWLDMTGSTLLFGSGREIAERLRREVREELGVTISVGVSFNKVFAKLGSDLKKPDAVSEIPPDRFREIVWGLSAREMIGAGLGVALASDYNPGSSPSGNMRMVVSLASIRMKMTPAEAINAATLNGAYAMGLSRDYGSITLGKVANFFITKPMPSVEFFSYAYQTPLIRRVFLKGSEFPAQA